MLIARSFGEVWVEKLACRGVWALLWGSPRWQREGLGRFGWSWLAEGFGHRFGVPPADSVKVWEQKLAPTSRSCSLLRVSASPKVPRAPVELVWRRCSLRSWSCLGFSCPVRVSKKEKVCNVQASAQTPGEFSPELGKCGVQREGCASECHPSPGWAAWAQWPFAFSSGQRGGSLLLPSWAGCRREEVMGGEESRVLGEGPARLGGVARGRFSLGWLCHDPARRAQG